MSKIEVSHIYKIFGPHPERWLKTAQEGMSSLFSSSFIENLFVLRLRNLQTRI